MGTGESAGYEARLTRVLRAVQSRMLVAMKLGSVVQFCSVDVDHYKDLSCCVG